MRGVNKEQLINLRGGCTLPVPGILVTTALKVHKKPGSWNFPAEVADLISSVFMHLYFAYRDNLITKL